MDIQSYLRMKNLFGMPMAQPGLDTSNPDVSANMPGLNNTQAPDTNQNLLEQFTPRHSISDAYTQSLTDMPQRPHPGALRNIAAAIAGMGAGASAQGIAGGQPIGFKYDPVAADRASDKVKYGDYDNQLTDWSNQVKALGLGANEEDRANVGEAKRVASNADREIKQQLADAKTSQIDINWQKEQDIFTTKKRDLEAKVNHWNAQEKAATEKLRREGETLANVKALGEARIKAQNARTELMGHIADNKLAETKMNHERVLAQMEAKQAPRQTDTTATYDSEGHVTSRRSTTGPGPAQILTDNEPGSPTYGKRFDTSTWSAADIAAAKAKGWR